MQLFIKSSLNLLFILISTFITLLVATTVVEVPWKGGILDSAFIYFNISAWCFLLTFVIYLFFRKKKIVINDSFTNTLAFLVPLIIGSITLFIFKAEPTTDALDCYNLANVIINDGIKTALKNDYLKQYPFQLGYIYLFVIFKLIFQSHSIIAIQITQIVIYAISNVFLLKITKLLVNKNNLNVPFLLLSTLWIIPVMYSVYCYGFSLGLSFSIISIYYIISYIQYNHKKHFIYALIFTIIATFLKPNYIILNITYILHFIFIFKKNFKVKSILVLMCLITTIFNLKSYEIITEAIFNVEVPKGLPKTSWLVMGTVDSNEINDYIYTAFEPGRWNGYNSERYEYLGDNFDQYVKEDISHLQKQIAFGLGNPKATLKFYFLKLANTWCVQDFMTTYTIIPQHLPMENLVEFMNDGAGNFLFTIGTRTALITIFIMAILFIINTKRFNDSYYIILIYFIGGFLYHLIFETRSVYVYPYITMLIPAACSYLANLEPLKQINFKYISSITLSVLIISFGFNYLTNTYESIDGECYYNFNPQSKIMNESTFISYTFDTNNIKDEIIGLEIQATGDLMHSDIIAHIQGPNMDTYINSDLVSDNNYQHYRFSLKNNQLKKDEKYTITLMANSDKFISDTIEIIYGKNSEADRSIVIDGQVLEGNTLNFKLITLKHSNPFITNDTAKQSIPLIWQKECKNIAKN